MVLAQLFAEEILHQADVVGKGIDADGIVGGRSWIERAVGSDRTLVLRLVATVKAVLEEMQGNAKAFEAEFVCETELTEAEEVFVKVLSKVAADELFASIVEGSNAIGSCMVAKCRSL